jgi:hypothetical protein
MYAILSSTAVEEANYKQAPLQENVCDVGITVYYYNYHNCRHYLSPFYLRHNVSESGFCSRL